MDKRSHSGTPEFRSGKECCELLLPSLGSFRPRCGVQRSVSGEAGGNRSVKAARGDGRPQGKPTLRASCQDAAQPSPCSGGWPCRLCPSRPTWDNNAHLSLLGAPSRCDSALQLLTAPGAPVPGSPVCFGPGRDPGGAGALGIARVLRTAARPRSPDAFSGALKGRSLLQQSHPLSDVVRELVALVKCTFWVIATSYIYASWSTSFQRMKMQTALTSQYPYEYGEKSSTKYSPTRPSSRVTWSFAAIKLRSGVPGRLHSHTPSRAAPALTR